jgi:shikimate dehydrogenase
LAGSAYNQRVPAPFTEPINANTRYCAVYGHPIRHSASPAMQNAGLAALGLNWRYLAFDVPPEELRPALGGAKAMGFVGINLTVPHKLLALEFVDAIDPSAKSWGAVNTICFEGRDEQGAWRPLPEFADVPREIRSHGFNTDADAITHALEEDLRITVTGKKILLLGAGGAGRTAALKFASESVAELFLINRTRSKAEALAREIGTLHPKVKLSLGYPKGRVDLVVNATSLGLKSADPLPFDETQFALHQVDAVYDMIYRPAETPLLKLARAAKCQTANGLSMLLHQGTKALELWTGRPAPVAAMRRALEQNVYG